MSFFVSKTEKSNQSHIIQSDYVFFIKMDIASLSSAFNSIQVEDFRNFPAYFVKDFGLAKTHTLIDQGFTYMLHPHKEDDWSFEITQDYESPYTWYVVGYISVNNVEDEKSLRFRYDNGQWHFTPWYP